MDSLRALDVALFRFINLDLKNGVLDWLLPFFNSNQLFVPVLALLAIWLTWKGGTRGRLLVCFLLLTFLIGDPLIVNSLKKFIGRVRPFSAMPDIHLLVGRSDNPSMPSGHAANWFAAATVAFIYYRRSVFFMLPMALVEAFSRVYLGVHYPADVMAGSLLGVTYALVIIWASNVIWQTIGSRQFPLWWRQVPSLIQPGMGLPTVQPSNLSTEASARPAAAATDEKVLLDLQWQRLAYWLIGGLLLGHLWFLRADKLELSEDEAYQWLWSKHLALSYFSKPPLIAYSHFLGTHLWGDTEFGIRFLSPVIAAFTSLLVVRFLARAANGFVAFLSVLVTTAVPLLMVGATLMTIDSLSVLFWVAAMIGGWNALRQDSTVAWAWTGLLMGLGFLGKYIALFQWVCWAVFFVLWPPARAQLRRPGPYLALLINLLCMVPVLVWNAQNHWITMTHLANRGGLDRGWQPTLIFFGEFLLSETFLLNPVFFVGLIWAAVVFWKRRPADALARYLFAMGAPLFLFYLAYTLRARVQPNWVAPALLPLLCLMVVYWDWRWREGFRGVQHALMAGLTLGWVVVVPLHDTRLISKLVGKQLPLELDPLKRVLAWKEMANTVQKARAELLTEGKPVFLIAAHYGATSLLSFYLPEAKAGIPDNPLVYCLSSDEPKNQFYFWPGYSLRKGQNAIYLASVDRDDRMPPPELLREFASVKDLGVRDVLYKNRVFHRVQLFACRDLR